MTRTLATLVLAAALAGCAQAGPRAASGLGALGVAARQASPETLDMAAYEKLTAAALAEAIDAGDAATVGRFVAYADGADPEPASTQAIANAALALLRAPTDAVTSAAADAGTADVARIARGQARRHKAAAKTGIVFPADEGSHGDALMEWWYLNGHLETRGIGPFKSRYGYEFTLFKVGPLLHWAHVAITDGKGKRFRYARQWVPNKAAQDTVGKADQAYGDQTFRLDGDTYRLGLKIGGDTLALALKPQKQPLLIGGNGKIDMPEGKDSWYYSQTRLAATGAVTLNGEKADVSGISWIDHQWGPFFVSGFLDRWDWFSLQFDDGTEYNLFGFRDRNGNAGQRHVNRSMPDGRGQTGGTFEMDRLAWWKSPVTGLNYTTKWRIALPGTGETVELTALVTDQEVARKGTFFQDPLPNYWEGAMVATKKTADGKRVGGRAYCEHFGFTKPEGPR